MWLMGDEERLFLLFLRSRRFRGVCKVLGAGTEQVKGCSPSVSKVDVLGSELTLNELSRDGVRCKSDSELVG